MATAWSGSDARDVGQVESKFHPPRPRSAVVVRDALLDRVEASDAPIVAVVAPAGYGKTTLLRLSEDRSPIASAWLSLDQHDNDPTVLLGYLLTALERIEPSDPDRRVALLAEAAIDSSWSLRRLAVIVSSMRTPFHLVLDHVEFVTNERCGDLIAAVALNLPPESRLLIGSRSAAPIPSARLRAEGRLYEIGRDDLAMNESEAKSLLKGVGTVVSTADLSELVERTEGWPVGLYLASLSLRAGGTGAALELVHGDSRVLADYLRTEVLSGLPASTASLLTRISVLDRFSGPLCDAVTGMRGAQDVLESLEESNLLLVPLDEQRRWYRFHHLLQELLRAELARTEPDMVTVLHDRAATWYEANGQLDAALEHALAAGDADRAGRLFGQIGAAVHGSGRAETVLRWLAWFEQRGLIDQYPRVASIGALLEALRGATVHSRLLADAAAANGTDGVAEDGTPVEGLVAAVETCLCRHGVGQMREDSALARKRLRVVGPLFGPATVLGGLAALIQGDDVEADLLLEEGVEQCMHSGNFPAAAAGSAERAVIALDRGDTASAIALSERALTVMTDARVDLYVHSTVVHGVAARVAVLNGEMRVAEEHLLAAVRLRTRCTAAIPWSAQFLLQLAYAYLALGDPRGARAACSQAEDIARTCADLGTIPGKCAELGQRLDTIATTSVGASSLSVAELRLLPFLATHLTYAEIGSRLFLSRNTIKSEAASILRKLGCSSRSAAVETAERVGLLGR